LPADNAEDRYAAIVRALGRRPGVRHEAAPGKGFGSSGQLKVNDRIFAMLVRGALVAKLPRDRVDALVAGKLGSKFDPRRNGRLMKEWLVIEPGAKIDWMAVAEEALAFVSRREKRGPSTKNRAAPAASSRRTSPRPPARSRR
jgi:hypothetical protein